MRRRSAIVPMRGSGDIRWDQVNLGMAHAALAGKTVGEMAHRAERAAQDGNLEAASMIEVDVQAGNDEVVVVVLGVGQPLRELAGGMVINVAERPDARGVGRSGPLLAQSSRTMSRNASDRLA